MNQDEYQPKVGLKDLHIAEVLQDDADGYSADTPLWLAPAADASQEPNTSSETLYADDAPYVVLEAEAETKVNLTITGISLEALAMITGKTFDDTTGRIYDHKGVPPYFALSFKSKKSNGKYRFYQFLKGKFVTPKEEHATEKDKPEAKTIQLTFTGIYTKHEFDVGEENKAVKRVIGDEDTDAFDAAGWFAAVQVPGVASVSALELSSSVPVNEATAVSRSADIVLTFNNALATSSLGNITLLDDDSAIVSCNKELNATKKVVTINPDADLAASTEHTVVMAGVKDIYGQSLTGIVTFTTGE